jgi:hypothetical protein
VIQKTGEDIEDVLDEVLALVKKNRSREET